MYSFIHFPPSLACARLLAIGGKEMAWSSADPIVGGRRGRNMPVLSQRRLLLAGALIALAAGSVTAFPPPRAFDPRPLMPAVEARAKDGRLRFVVFGDSKNNPPFTAVLDKAA